MLPLSAWRFLWGVCVLLTITTRICVGAGGGASDKAAYVRNLKSNWSHYRHMAQMEATIPREVELERVLRLHRGVYKDDYLNQRFGLTQTVIIIVQLVQKQKQTSHPRPKMSLLNNMICHLERHGLMSVVYLSRYLFNASIPVQSHFVSNDNILYLPFPDFSFWDMLVTQGKTSSTPIDQTARYPYPNFKEYGDRTTLFAVLELLKYNLNVILLDDDVMLLRDPIPFLINSHITADIVTPEDTRQCVFLANPLLDVSKGNNMKPEINIGVTFFRSRAAVVNLVRRWMHLVVYNGQKVFSLFRRFVEADTSCHTRRRVVTEIHSADVRSNVGVNLSFTSDSKALSICYLSNTLFQNGYVNSFRCGKYNKNPVYLMTLSEEILAHRDYFSPHNTLAKNYSLEMASSAQDLEDINTHNTDDLHLLTPVTIHPNYEGKELTIKNYFFWVYELGQKESNSSGGANQNKTCKAFSLSEQWKQMNATYQHLYNVIQRRKNEAKVFLDQHAMEVSSNITSFFYVTEALPPTIVFRFNSVLSMFEVFDVVPNSFIQSTFAGHSSTARIFIPRDYNNMNNTSYSGPSSWPPFQEVVQLQVNVTPFSIFGDKSHQLVATFPIHNHLSFWAKNSPG